MADSFVFCFFGFCLQTHTFFLTCIFFFFYLAHMFFQFLFSFHLIHTQSYSSFSRAQRSDNTSVRCPVLNPSFPSPTSPSLPAEWQILHFREGKSEGVIGRQAQKGGERESQAASVPSVEPDVGLEPMNHEIVIKSRALNRLSPRAP